MKKKFVISVLVTLVTMAAGASYEHLIAARGRIAEEITGLLPDDHLLRVAEVQREQLDTVLAEQHQTVGRLVDQSAEAEHRCEELSRTAELSRTNLKQIQARLPLIGTQNPELTARAARESLRQCQAIDMRLEHQQTLAKELANGVDVARERYFLLQSQRDDLRARIETCRVRLQTAKTREHAARELQALEKKLVDIKGSGLADTVATLETRVRSAEHLADYAEGDFSGLYPDSPSPAEPSLPDVEDEIAQYLHRVDPSNPMTAALLP